MTTRSANEAGPEKRLKPKLLVLASTYPRWPGDPEPSFVHELSRRLIGAFDVTVLCPHAQGTPGREVMDGVQVIRYRYAPASLEILVNDGGIVTNLKRRPWAWLLVPGFLLLQAWALWRLVRTEQPEVIHAHWLIPQGLLVAALGALGFRVPPFLVTSHGADLFALRGRAFDALKRFVLHRAAAATVVSQGMLEKVVRIGGDVSRVAVEPMGVDLQERFRPDPEVRRSQAELLFVGRLVEKKGLRYLLDAMPRILGQCPQASLTVAGFGPEEAARRAQAEHLGIAGRVNFLGAVPQAGLPELYRRAAVFAAPFVETASGDQEGLGLVVVEALGCGCPVVISSLPATRAFVEGMPGVRGVRAGDAGELAAQVIEAIRTPLALRRDALDDFDWHARADAYRERLLAVAALGSR